ncbi:MAG: FecR domain-containing protein [Crocinitomicaceae bacterium]
MSNEEINEAKLIAYLNKELSNEEMIKVDLWLGQSSKNMEKFSDIRKIWMSSGELKSKPVVVDTDAAWNKVLGQVDTGEKVIPINQNKPNRFIFPAIAAALVLLGGILSVLFMMNNDIPQMEMTSQAEVVKDVLSDGTEVTLNENSMLSYPKEFTGDERRVQLSGEAFFDVERDEKKPFIIDLHNEFYVKVLGTSFNIDANDNDSITEVYVKSGKVEFGSVTDKIILTAGEKGIMNNETGTVRKVVDETAGFKETFWMDQTLDFDGEPLFEVLQVLSDVYNVEIILDCETAKNDPIRSSHPQETILEVLEVIAEVHHLKVNFKDGSYHMECND